MPKITKSYLCLLHSNKLVAFEKAPLKMPRLSKRATLIKEYESIAESRVVKAYVRFCFTMMTALRMTLIIAS